MGVETGDKVFRLVRLRRFQEQRASADLRAGLSEAARTESALREAGSKVEGVALWKARPDGLGALDLDTYQAALAYEHEAMIEQSACKQDHERSLLRCEEATGRYIDAASATKVAEQRHGRHAAEAHEQAEKRGFDQLSDLLGSLEKKNG